MFLLQNLLKVGTAALNISPRITFMNTIQNQKLFSSLANSNVKFLSPLNVIISQSAGFKVKGHLRKRCKDCYFVRRQERLYVICNTHRRHKQMQMVKDERNTWILSHATQSKIRPW